MLDLHDDGYSWPKEDDVLAFYMCFGNIARAVAYPQIALAAKRGWSTREGPSASQTHPRGGSPWNDKESRDLLVAAAGKINLTTLARAHGRTEHAIACRLEALGVGREVIIASDFSPVSTLNDNPITEKTMTKAKTKLTPESRLRTLLSIALGDMRDLPPQDIPFLLSDGLIELDSSSVPAHLRYAHTGKLGVPKLTSAGKALVDSLVARTTSRTKVDTYWDDARGTSVLNDSRFFMVASGDAAAGLTLGRRPQLRNPPRVVQASGRDAEKEALRLATENRGQKFFVLQAVSVHEVQPTPASSKQL